MGKDSINTMATINNSLLIHITDTVKFDSSGILDRAQLDRSFFNFNGSTITPYDAISRNFEEGKALVQQGSYEDALIAFNDALSLDTYTSRGNELQSKIKIYKYFLYSTVKLGEFDAASIISKAITVILNPANTNNLKVNEDFIDLYRSVLDQKQELLYLISDEDSLYYTEKIESIKSDLKLKSEELKRYLEQDSNYFFFRHCTLQVLTQIYKVLGDNAAYLETAVQAVTERDFFLIDDYNELYMGFSQEKESGEHWSDMGIINECRNLFNETSTTGNIENNYSPRVLNMGYLFLSMALKTNTTTSSILLLNNAQLNDYQIITISKALENNRTVTNFDMGENHLTTRGIESIADVLIKNKFLTDLYLYSTDLGDNGAIAIAQALRKNTTLTSINLWGNGIGETGAKEIASALEENTTLNFLNIGCNPICENGVKAIASALEKNTTLTCLYMNEAGINDNEDDEDIVDNRAIGDNKAKAIAEALEKNQTLTTLNITDNGIGDEGAKAIAKALENNHALTALHISSNNIGYEGLLALAEALQKNTTLTTLEFDSDQSSEMMNSVIAAIKAKISDNKNIVLMSLHYDSIDKEMKSVELEGILLEYAFKLRPLIVKDPNIIKVFCAKCKDTFLDLMQDRDIGDIIINFISSLETTLKENDKMEIELLGGKRSADNANVDKRTDPKKLCIGDEDMGLVGSLPSETGDE